MPEQASNDLAASTVSEAEFVKLCDDIYADHQQIYEFNPGMSKRDAVLWMLLGCLMSLLSATPAVQSSVDDKVSADPYGDAIREVLHTRMQPRFDPNTHLAELLKKIEASKPN